MKRIFSLILVLLLVCSPMVFAQDAAEVSLTQDAWYELNDDVLIVRLPMDNAASEAWHFQIGNEQVIELLTNEVIGDEESEYAYAHMWAGSFKSFGSCAGRTVMQFTRTDESGKVVEVRLLHVAAAEDMSLEIVTAVENSFFYLNEDCTALYVSLDANATTGYSWSYALSDEEILTCTKEEYVPFPTDGIMVGSGGTFEAQFAGTFKKAGHVTLTLSYARPWESVQPIESHEIKLFVNEANLIELLADEPEQDGFESGRYEDDGYSSLILTKNADGTYGFEISIYRLTMQDDGVGVYADGVLTVTATDASGGKMVWTLTMEEDVLKAVVAESTWAYLPVGETFLFEKEISE